MEKFKSRNFCLVLYDEDETHKQAIEKIKQSYDYALILHDRDINNDTGELKKPHYHVVLRFDNNKWNTALAEELGIEVNYLQEARSLKRSLLYLIHYYDEDKFKYEDKNVQGPLRKKLIEYLSNEGKSESEKVLEILEEIDGIESFIYFSTFVKHIAKIGYWDVFRRSTGVFIKYIDEHNSHFL